MTTSQKRWEVFPPAPEEYLAGFPDLPQLVVQILYNRGIRAVDDAGAFLSRTVSFDNPFRLKGMNAAVARLRQALHGGEAIAVYGDYDADGVTATALLVPMLRALGAEVIPHIPNRMDEGYGLNKTALSKLASEGIDVVVTVDCGVRSHDEVAYANGLGLDVVITDHHGVGAKLPAAIAVIDPKRADGQYPFKQFAGVGLAFKLAQALLRVERQLPTCEEAELPDEEAMLDLVALGTVADLAPLLGENRALVSRGLERLNMAQRPGIAALLHEAGLRPGQVKAGSVGYVLGPRLNAAGRLDDACASYRLLTTSSATEAEELAQQLGEQNRERQRLTQEMVSRARQQVREFEDAGVYVLADSSYASGIAGLVASRIQDEFYRPTLVIALEEGLSKGSARSIRGFHITQALQECGNLLERFGGHSAAAGFTIRSGNIGALREKLNEIATRDLDDDDLVASLAVDAEIPLAAANSAIAEQLETLQPFGIGNPRPTLISHGVHVRACHSVGRDGAHLKMRLSDGTDLWDAIAFRQAVPPEAVPARIDVAYNLQNSEWKGRKRLELIVKDWRPAASDLSSYSPEASGQVGGDT